MAGAVSVDESIWLPEILRHNRLAERPGFQGSGILALEYSSHAVFAAFGIAIDFQIIISIAQSETALCALHVWRR
jgi:hypothetical protein